MGFRYEIMQLEWIQFVWCITRVESLKTRLHFCFLGINWYLTGMSWFWLNHQAKPKTFWENNNKIHCTASYFVALQGDWKPLWEIKAFTPAFSEISFKHALREVSFTAFALVKSGHDFHESRSWEKSPHECPSCFWLPIFRLCFLVVVFIVSYQQKQKRRRKLPILMEKPNCWPCCKNKYRMLKKYVRLCRTQEKSGKREICARIPMRGRNSHVKIAHIFSWEFSHVKIM